MPLIKVVPPEEAQGKVKQGYDMFAQFGMVPAPFLMYTPSPELVGMRTQGIGYYMGHPNLSPGLLALIRMLVAEELKYYYCISLNTEILKSVGILDEDAAAKVLADPAGAPLEDKDKAMQLYEAAAEEEKFNVTNVWWATSRAKELKGAR